MVGETNVFFGSLLLTLSSLILLAFVAMEAPWERQMLNTWHLLNEAVFFIVCSGLMCFSGMLNMATQSVSLGWILVGLIFVMIIYNSIIIIFDVLIYLRLCILRHRKKFPAKLIKLLLSKNAPITPPEANIRKKKS